MSDFAKQSQSPDRHRTKPTAGDLLGFAVRLVLPAVRTELLHLEAFRRGFLILRVRIVPVFALGALERDDFSWHELPLHRTKRPPRGSRFVHFSLLNQINPEFP